jgi:exonuclease VII small subunit
MYEQGMKLSQICTNILKSTEVKITEIQTKYSDEMSSSDQ